MSRHFATLGRFVASVRFVAYPVLFLAVTLTEFHIVKVVDKASPHLF